MFETKSGSGGFILEARITNDGGDYPRQV